MKKKSLFKFLSLSLMAFAFAGLLTLGINFLSKDVALDKTSQEESVTYADAHSTIYRSDWDSFKYTYSSEISNVTSVVTANSAPSTTGSINEPIGYSARVDINGTIMTIYSTNNAQIDLPSDSSYFFFDSMSWLGIFSHVTTMDLQNFYTPSVTSTAYMFYNCSSLYELDLSSFDMNNVSYADSMFDGCNNLRKIYLPRSVSYSYNIYLTHSYHTEDWNYSGYYLNYFQYTLSTPDNKVLIITDDVPSQDAVIYKNSWDNFKNDCSNQIQNITRVETRKNYNPYTYHYELGENTYAYFNGNTLEIYTTLNKDIELPSDCSAFFFDIYNNSDIFRNVNTMVLQYFDTSDVTNMMGMLYGLASLTELDLSNFNTPRVTNMSYMFQQCQALISLDLTGFDTRSVTDMNNMFSYCYALTSLDLSSFNTSNVTNMNSLFYYCQALTSLDLSSFKTSNVENMRGMFYGCQALTNLELLSFNTSNVTDMSYMFCNCYNLYELDISSFNMSNVSLASAMFSDCNNLHKIYLPRSKNSSCDVYLPYEYRSIGYWTQTGHYLNDFSSSLGTLIVTNSVASQDAIIYESSWNSFKNQYSSEIQNITRVETKKGYNSYDYVYELGENAYANFNGETLEIYTRLNKDIELPSDCEYFFYNHENSSDIFRNVAVMDLRCFNTSNVTDMSYMFYRCQALTDLDLSSFNTRKLRDVSYMFSGCAMSNINLSGFDTSNVTNMTGMFSYSSFQSLDLTSFNTSKVVNMSYMFAHCGSLYELDISSFDLSRLSYTNSGTFTNCNNLRKIYLPRTINSSYDFSLPYSYHTEDGNYSGSKLNNFSSTLSTQDHKVAIITNSVPSRDATISRSNWDSFKSDYSDQIQNITRVETKKDYDPNTYDYELGENTYAYFNGNTLEIYTTLNKDIELPSDCSYFFYDLINEQGIFNNVTAMVLQCFDTSNVTDMSRMFLECTALTSLDLSGFNTSNVTNMSYMFQQCQALISLDLTGFDTSNVTDMSHMFFGCSTLTNLDDLSNFDTSNVTDMSYIFGDCVALTSIELSNFDTSNVITMTMMFEGCHNLVTLDLSSFNTSTVVDMVGMFFDCSTLISLDLSMFDTSNVTDMYAMFDGCSALTNLDLSSFNTSRVTSMMVMFGYNPVLTSLDLSSFDMGAVTNAEFMFYNCRALTQIYVPKVLPDIKNVSTIDLPGNSDGTTATYSLVNDDYTTQSTNLMDFPVSTTGEKQQIVRGSSAAETIDIQVSGYGSVNVESFEYREGQEITTSGNQLLIDGVVVATANPEKFDGYIVKVSWDLTNIESNIVKANFVKTPRDYTITYKLNGGSVSVANPTTYNLETTTFTLNNPTKTGYTFTGWSGTGLNGKVKTVKITKGSQGNRSYSANFTVNQYTITLKDGDNVIKTIKQNYGTSISVANPEKLGYTFAGWDTSLPSKMPAENMTINARFTLTNYTITYKLDDGQVQGKNPKLYTIESEDFTLINPTKEGYDFCGWIETENDEPIMEYVVAQGSTGNKTLTAVWTEKLQQEEEEEKKQQDSSLIIGASIGGGIALAGLAGGLGIIFGSKRKKVV